MRQSTERQNRQPPPPPGMIPFERGEFSFSAHPDPDLDALVGDRPDARPLAILAHHKPTGLEFQFTLDAPWAHDGDWDIILDHRTAGELSLGRIERIKQAAEILLVGLAAQSPRLAARTGFLANAQSSQEREHVT